MLVIVRQVSKYCQLPCMLYLVVLLILCILQVMVQLTDQMFNKLCSSVYTFQRRVKSLYIHDDIPLE